jgi:hypothetical protein
MEIILSMHDIAPRGRGKSHRELDLMDFATMDLRSAQSATKITFIYGKEKFVLKDRYGRQR